MTMKFKKAAVAVALALAATVGFAAPALADGGSFNACPRVMRVAKRNYSFQLSS